MMKKWKNDRFNKFDSIDFAHLFKKKSILKKMWKINRTMRTIKLRIQFNSKSNIIFKHFFKTLRYFCCFIFNERNFFARILSIFFFQIDYLWIFLKYIMSQMCHKFVVFMINITKFQKQKLRSICCFHIRYEKIHEAKFTTNLSRNCYRIFDESKFIEQNLS